MKRLVDYESTDSEEESDSSEEDELISEEAKIERDVRAAVNYLLNQTSKLDSCDDDRAKFTFDRKGYRDMLASNGSDFSSGTSDSEGTSSALSEDEGEGAASDDSDCVYSRIVITSRLMKKRTVRPGRIPKTKGEISLTELPPIESLRITVPETVLFTKVGVISSVVDSLVIILSDFNVPALDEDTLLFSEDRQSVGKVFETFGPVIRPFYSIRFNNKEEVSDNQLKPGTKIYFVPDHSDFTHPIFTDSLRQLKGTDASWEDNNEPPLDVIEFSDDEEEKRFKARRRGKLSNNITAENGPSNCSALENAPTPKKRLKARRRGVSRRGASTSAFHVASSSQYNQLYGTPQNPVPFSTPHVYRPRNPWTAPFQPMFNASVPPPPPPRGSNWLWFSEETFRLPPPPLPHGFGRMRMVVPPPLNSVRPNISSPVPSVVTDHRFIQRNA